MINNKRGLGRGLDALFGVFDEDDSYKNITKKKNLKLWQMVWLR